MDALFEPELWPTGQVLFAEDFDQPRQSHPGVVEPEVIEPSFSAAELEAARADAYQAGRDAAASEALVADHAALRASAAAMAAQLTAGREELRALAEESAAATARLLLAALGAVLPELAARHGEAELAAVIRAVLPGLFREAAVTVRLHPQHCAAIAAEIEQLDPDFATRVRIVPTDTMRPGDVRLAWRNGSACRDTAAIWSEIADALGMVGLAPTSEVNREVEHAG